jgi:hypothetical protein
MADAKLERTLAALPPDLREEVEDFAAFLLARRVAGKSDATGEAHPLASLAGVWLNEPLADKDLLPKRSLGRDVDL